MRIQEAAGFYIAIKSGNPYVEVVAENAWRTGAFGELDTRVSLKQLFDGFL